MFQRFLGAPLKGTMLSLSGAVMVLGSQMTTSLPDDTTSFIRTTGPRLVPRILLYAPLPSAPEAPVGPMPAAPSAYGKLPESPSVAVDLLSGAVMLEESSAYLAEHPATPGKPATPVFLTHPAEATTAAVESIEGVYTTIKGVFVAEAAAPDVVEVSSDAINLLALTTSGEAEIPEDTESVSGRMVEQ